MIQMVIYPRWPTQVQQFVHRNYAILTTATSAMSLPYRASYHIASYMVAIW